MKLPIRLAARRCVADGGSSRCRTGKIISVTSATPASAGAFARRWQREMLGTVVGVVALLAAGTSFAQQPPAVQTAVVVTDSLSQLVGGAGQTVAPLAGRTAVYESADGGMNRAERRALKAQHFATDIDSLVQSRRYLFVPTTMQELPGGVIRNIYVDFFYFGLLGDHVEVHLPTERGITQYVEMLNFDSMNLRNYQASRMQWGWNVTFKVIDGEVCYAVNIDVSTVTGETVLTLLTPSVTMRYVGWLWDGGRRNEHLRR